jgi:hypothetical protein
MTMKTGDYPWDGCRHSLCMYPESLAQRPTFNILVLCRPPILAIALSLNNIPMFEQGEGGTAQTSKEQAQSKMMQLKQSVNELSSFPVASVSAAYDDRELSSNKRMILMDRRATAHAGCGCGIVGNNDNRNTYKVRTAITLLELN